LVLASGVAACDGPTQLYPGPQRPFSEIARLCCHVSEIRSSLIGAKVRIQAIDGRSFAYFENWAELPPGRHEVAYAYLEGVGAYPLPVLPLSENSGRLVFNAQPGRGYILRADRRAERVYAWIEDEADRALVAGQRPDTP
jgi:hypothetical protein